MWSVSSAPRPQSSLQDAEVPLVSCLLGFPALSSVHSNPAKQIPIRISQATTTSRGTGRRVSALRQANAGEDWGESGESVEGKRKSKAAGRHEESTQCPKALPSQAPRLPSAAPLLVSARRLCPACMSTRPRHLIQSLSICEVWSLPRQQSESDKQFRPSCCPRGTYIAMGNNTETKCYPRQGKRGLEKCYPGKRVDTVTDAPQLAKRPPLHRVIGNSLPKEVTRPLTPNMGKGRGHMTNEQAGQAEGV